jgi:hypothetical protein
MAVAATGFVNMGVEAFLRRVGASEVALADGRRLVAGDG